MALPFLIFWVTIFFARRELGWRGTAIFIALWIGLLIGFLFAGVSPCLFVSVQALLDCILILVIFRGDIRIN